MNAKCKDPTLIPLALRIMMKLVKLTIFLLLAFEFSACRQHTQVSRTEKFLLEIQQNENIVANDATNYSAYYNLSQLYTGYYKWLAANNRSEATSYKEKALDATDRAVLLTSNSIAHVFLAMTYEDLKEPHRALPLYKQFLTEPEQNRTEASLKQDVMPRLQTEVHEEMATLTANVNRRIHAIEDQDASIPPRP
jgi:hypothetical protein